MIGLIALALGGVGATVGASGAPAPKARDRLASAPVKPAPPPNLSKAPAAPLAAPLSAIQLRIARQSHSRYGHLSSAAAKEIDRRRFGVLWAAARDFYQPLMLRKGERLVRYLSAKEALVREPARPRKGQHATPGRVVVAQSTLPMEVGSGKHARPVNLSLRTEGASLEPVQALVPTTLTPTGLSFPDSGISVRLLGADQRQAENLGTVAFTPSVMADTDLASQPTPTGAEQWLSLRSAASPEVFRFALGLPKGTSSKVAPDGSVAVTDDKRDILEIAPPTVTDALGRPVNASYKLDGPRLILSVQHRQDKTVAYPVSVDPIYDISGCLPNVQDPFNYVDVDCGIGTTGPASTGSPETFSQWTYYQNSSALTHATTGFNGSGLYVIANPGTSYTVGNYGEWIYQAPAGAFIQRVDFETTQHNYWTTSSGSPSSYLFEGIFDKSAAQWEPETAFDNYGGAATFTYLGQQPYTISANRTASAGQYLYVGNSAVPQNPLGFGPVSSVTGANGNEAVVGLSLTAAGSRPSSPDDWAYVGGATVWLYDFTSPTITTTAPGSVNGGAWTDDGATTYTLTPSASDNSTSVAGLGMKALELQTANQSGPGTTATTTTMQNDVNPCAADHVGVYCPQSWSGSLSYSLAQGIDNMSLIAQDATGNTSWQNFSAKIDRTAPSATLSGVLYAGRSSSTNSGGSSVTQPLTGPRYALDINATDAQSGVAEIDVSVDGGSATVFAGNCTTSPAASAGCDTGDSAQYTYASQNYPTCSTPASNGTCQHTITVTVKDWLGTSLWGQPGRSGHSWSTSFAIYTKPAPSLTSTETGGVSQLQSDSLGLEKFYAYRSIGTGDGSTLKVNEGTGNAVWSWTPVNEPGQGQHSSIQLAYNSQQPLASLQSIANLLGSSSYNQAGSGWSVSIDGLTRLNDPLDLSQQANGQISFTDPTGATHTFLKQSTGQWTAPPGLFMHLRQWAAPASSKYDWNRAWAITVPDGTTYFFDALGYESAIQDRVGNTTTFNRAFVLPANSVLGGLPVAPTLCGNPITSTVLGLLDGMLSSTTKTETLGVGCAEQTTSVEDQNGRYINVRYSGSGTTVSPIASITDHAGEQLQFNYSSGQLSSVVAGYGVAGARTFTFGYGGASDPAIPTSGLAGLLGLAGLGASNLPAQLTSIKDPRQNTTTIGYASATSAPNHCPTASSDPSSQISESVAEMEPVCALSITARDGGVTQFGYEATSPAGKSTCASGAECTQVTGPQTDQNNAAQLWFTSFDSSLRPTEAVDPLGRETQTTWNALGAAAPNTVAQQLTGEVPTGFSTTAAAACQAYTYDSDGDVLSDQGPSEGTSCPISPFRQTSYTYSYSAGPGALQAPSGADGGGQFVADVTKKAVNADPSGTNPTTEVTTYTYDSTDGADGLITSVQDPAGQIWSTSYYTGAPTGWTAAAPSASRDVFSSSFTGQQTTDFGGGLIASQTDPDGNVTRYGNAVGQFSSGTLAANSGYDPNGLPELVYKPGQSTTLGAGSTPTVYQYDTDGHVIAQTDPRYWTDGTPTTIALITGADTASSANPASSGTDPVISQSNVTTPFTSYYQYDPFGDQTASWTPKDSAAGASGTWLADSATYDQNANTTATTVGNQITAGAASTPSSSPAVTTDYGYTVMDRQDSKTVLSVPSSEASSGTSQTTSYCYDLNGFETDQVLPAGQATATSCAGGIALAANEPSGTSHAAHYVLDADGDRLVSEQISSQSNGTSLQTPQDRLNSYAYDAAGNQIASADPADNLGASIAAAEANAAAALTGNYGPWRTRAVYDAAGEAVANIENPDIRTASGGYELHSSFSEYDPAGNLIGSESAKDTQSQGSAPALNAGIGQYQLTATPGVTSPVPGISSYIYDARNLLLSSTDPDGDKTLYGRQNDGKICWIMSPDGVQYQQKQGNSLPASSSCSATQQTLPDTTGYSYTAQGWVSQITLPKAPNEYSYPAGTMQVSYSYDPVGDPTTIMDPDHNPIQNKFYDTGDLKQTSQPWWWTTNPEGSSSNSPGGPDPNNGGSGQLTPETPGRGLAVQQKSLQQIIEDDDKASSSSPSLPPDGISGQLGEVPAATLPGILPNAGTTQLGYDGLMQLTSVAGPQALAQGQTPATTGSPLMSYLAYDPNGNLTSLTQPFDGSTGAGPNSSITSFTYDQDGNKKTETDPAIATAGPLGQYVASGNTDQQGAPQSAPQTVYTYDGLDRLASATAPGAGASETNQSPTTNTTTYCYYLNPTGGAGAGTSGGSACAVDGGSLAQTPVAVAEPNGASVAATSRVLTINPSNQVTSTDYDATGEQIDTTDPLGNETSYGYDAVGDQTTDTRPKGNPAGGPTLVFGGPATAPSGLYTTTSSYDLAGRLTQTATKNPDGSTNQSTYGYDPDGNLTSQALPGAAASSGGAAVPQVTDYRYNGRGLLWSTTTGGGSGSDGQANMRTTVVETDGDGNVVRTVNPAGTAAGGLPYYSYDQGYSATGEAKLQPAGRGRRQPRRHDQRL